MLSIFLSWYAAQYTDSYFFHEWYVYVLNIKVILKIQFFLPWDDCTVESFEWRNYHPIVVHVFLEHDLIDNWGVCFKATFLYERNIFKRREAVSCETFFFVHNLQFLLKLLFFCCVYKLNQLRKVQAYSLYSAKICHFVLTARQVALPVGATIYQAGRVTIFIAFQNLSWIVIFEGLTLLFEQASYIQIYKNGNY